MAKDDDIARADRSPEISLVILIIEDRRILELGS